MKIYPTKDYPIELEKKMTLLQHFREYLQGEKYNNDKSL